MKKTAFLLMIISSFLQASQASQSPKSCLKNSSSGAISFEEVSHASKTDLPLKNVSFNSDVKPYKCVFQARSASVESGMDIFTSSIFDVIKNNVAFLYRCIKPVKTLKHDKIKNLSDVERMIEEIRTDNKKVCTGLYYRKIDSIVRLLSLYKLEQGSWKVLRDDVIDGYLFDKQRDPVQSLFCYYVDIKQLDEGAFEIVMSKRTRLGCDSIGDKVKSVSGYFLKRELTGIINHHLNPDSFINAD